MAGGEAVQANRAGMTPAGEAASDPATSGWSGWLAYFWLPNRPFERAGMNALQPAGAASAGRSTPLR
jgi:hypothetical protein